MPTEKRKKGRKKKKEKDKMTKQSMKFNGESDLIARKKKGILIWGKKLFCDIKGVQQITQNIFFEKTHNFYSLMSI